MIDTNYNFNRESFLTMYYNLRSGNVLAPRGQKIKEVENYQLWLRAGESPCTSFSARNFNLSYAKAETLWYLRGDRFDRSIEAKASTWPKIIQPDGSYYSNYGHYIFAERQYDWVVDELSRDKDSRRASIILTKKEHFFAENRDVVCTYGMNFRIRGDELNMSVSMRSNDAIFGTTNDVFSFLMLYRMVRASLMFGPYPDLRYGMYCHKADSLHVYERHWGMLDNIVSEGKSGYSEIFVPEIAGSDELKYLLSLREGYNYAPLESFHFSRWLMEP